MKKTSKILTISSILFLGLSALTFTGNLTSQKPAYAEDLKECDPEPTDTILNYWDRLTCSLEQRGDSDIFRLEGTAGDRIIVSFSGNGNKRVEVIDPKGNTLDSRHSNGARFELTLEQTGTYTFVVSTGDSSGDYLIEVSCVIGSCLAESPQ